MQYVPPIGGAAGDPYIDADPGAAIEGSAVPAAAIEDPMRELVALITDAGLAPSDANLSQVAAAVRTLIQSQAAAVSVAGGTSDAITGIYTPGIAALTNGMKLYVRAGLANATTTPTFTPASGTIAANVIVKGAGAALVAGDIAGAGHWIELQYDLTLDKWVLLNPANGVSITAGLPTGYKFGLVLANNGATQIDISTGKARSAADNYDLVLAATMTKTLQAVGAWAAGTNQNGLFSGAKANSTWYHCFLIRKDADGSIDAGFDTSITAANKPAGYSNYRRIGSILTDASGNIRSFLQVGNKFIWTTPINDVAVSSGPADNTPTLYVISTPPGIRGQASIVGGVIAANAYCSISSPDSSAPTITTYTNAGPWLVAVTGSIPDCAFSYAEVNTNLSSQIRVTTFSDGNGITRTGVSTLGWTELN